MDRVDTAYPPRLASLVTRFARRPLTSPLSAMPITISSRLAFPALSPMPFMVHSSCLAPFMAPARLFAVLRPRSFWQWVLKTTLSAPGTLRRRLEMRSPNSQGMFQPVVSGMFRVVAPEGVQFVN